MRKKQWISMLLASAMAFSLVACGGQAEKKEEASDSNSSKEGKQKITFTFRDDGADLEKGALYRWVTSAYDSWDKKDEVELDIAPITASEGDFFTKMALQLADKKTCPDLITEDTFQLPNDVAAGYLTNLDSYVANYEDWNNGAYYDSMRKLGSYEGSVYGIPYCTDTRGLFYNKKVLTEAGVIKEGEEWSPQNWDDIMKACETIKKNSPDVIPFWCNSGVATGEATSMQTYEMLLYGTGERLLTDDGKWITNSQGIEDSLQFLSDIYKNGYGPSLSLVLNGQASATSAREYLPQAKLGILLDGIWITGAWKEGSVATWEGYENEVGLAPMPTSKGQEPKTITMSGGHALSIPENSDAKDIAFEFLVHMMSPEVYLETIVNQGNISTRTDIIQNDAYAKQPFFVQATNFLETAEFRPQNEQYSPVSTCIQSMVESVVSGTSPKDAMKQYHIDVERTVGADNVNK